MKFLLRAMTASTVSALHFILNKWTAFYKVKAVVDCVVDKGRCDKTGNEVKKFAETAVCLPRFVKFPNNYPELTLHMPHSQYFVKTTVCRPRSMNSLMMSFF